MEDMFLRLDKEIASILNYLDNICWKRKLFNVPDCVIMSCSNAEHRFFEDRKIPFGVFFNVITDLNVYLKNIYKKNVRLVDTIINYQVY